MRSAFRTCLFQNTDFFSKMSIRSLLVTPRPSTPAQTVIISLPEAFSGLPASIPLSVSPQDGPSEMYIQAFTSPVHNHLMMLISHRILTSKAPRHPCLLPFPNSRATALLTPQTRAQEFSFAPHDLLLIIALE